MSKPFVFLLFLCSLSLPAQVRLAWDEPNYFAEPLDHAESMATLFSNGERIVGVNSSGSLVTSTDGRSWWVWRDKPTLFRPDFAWSGERFLAVTRSYSVLTSATGISWDEVSVPDATGVFYSVASNGSLHVAVGAGVTATSLDAQQWQVHAFEGHLVKVCWGLGRFIAVTDSGDSYTSEDGVVWQAGASTGGLVFDLAASDEIAVAVGYGVFISRDGLSWRKLFEPENRLDAVSWNGSGFDASGSGSSLVFHSRDGIAWQSLDGLPASGPVARLGDLLIAGKLHATRFSSDLVRAPLIFPHITDPQGHFRTLVLLNNPSDTTHSYGLFFYAEDGELLREVQGSLEGGRSLEEKVVDLVDGVPAYLTVDPASALSVSLAYQRADGQGARAQVSPSSEVASGWSLLPSAASGFWDGVALVNRGSSSTDVFLRFRAADGAAGEPVVMLSGLVPGGRGLANLAAWVSPDPGGRYEIFADQPLALIALSGDATSRSLFGHASQVLEVLQ